MRAQLGLRKGGGGAPREQAAGGGARPWWRRFRGLGRWWRGRGAPVSGEELVSGGGSGRGRAKEGAPRRPIEERRPWRRGGVSGRLKRTKGEEGGGLGAGGARH